MVPLFEVKIDGRRGLATVTVKGRKSLALALVDIAQDKQVKGITVKRVKK